MPLPKPLKLSYRVLCLALMGIFFYTTYGLANHWASTRAFVPELFWTWEQHIPFWAWTIVPYWSLNVFYAAAFFVCRNQAQLHRLLQQLILAQLIAIMVFVAWPLTFSWAKPITNGLLGDLFNALAGFDQPYNQAPSLHIILTVILGRFYWYRFARAYRFVWLLWLMLIGLSVLTTYQHHFIDVPTGLLVGLLVLWCRPMHLKQPMSRLSFQLPSHTHLSEKRIGHVSTSHRLWAAVYALMASILMMVAILLQDAYWWCVWPALALSMMAVIYALDAPHWLQKQPNACHTVAISLLMLPWLLCVRLNMAFWLFNQAKSHAICPNVHIGSILAAKKYSFVIDVCAEYPARLSPNTHYMVIPMLDMTPPHHVRLRVAADALHEILKEHPDATILLTCALGYSRSCAVWLTYCLRFRLYENLQDALADLKHHHPNVVIPDNMHTQILKAAHDAT